jgi:hypothetical protein
MKELIMMHKTEGLNLNPFEITSIAGRSCNLGGNRRNKDNYLGTERAQQIATEILKCTDPKDYIFVRHLFRKTDSPQDVEHIIRTSLAILIDLEDSDKEKIEEVMPLVAAAKVMIDNVNFPRQIFNELALDILGRINPEIYIVIDDTYLHVGNLIESIHFPGPYGLIYAHRVVQDYFNDRMKLDSQLPDWSGWGDEL